MHMTLNNMNKALSSAPGSAFACCSVRCSAPRGPHSHGLSPRPNNHRLTPRPHHRLPLMAQNHRQTATLQQRTHRFNILRTYLASSSSSSSSSGGCGGGCCRARAVCCGVQARRHEGQGGCGRAAGTPWRCTAAAAAAAAVGQGAPLLLLQVPLLLRQPLYIHKAGWAEAAETE
jgi:hypothetical protein